MGNKGYGGARPGAGRPPGRGPFGERTKSLRVPESLADGLVSFLGDYRTRKRDASVPAIPAAQQPAEVLLQYFLVKVPAGFPSPADDYLEDGVDLNRLMVRNAPATFFYTVSGDSMDKAGILNGDKVIVDRSIEAKSGDIVIAVIPGDGHTIKRLRLRGGKPALMPESSNSDHKPRLFKDDDELHIWGVVTGVVRQYRK